MIKVMYKEDQLTAHVVFGVGEEAIELFAVFSLSDGMDEQARQVCRQVVDGSQIRFSSR